MKSFQTFSQPGDRPVPLAPPLGELVHPARARVGSLATATWEEPVSDAATSSQTGRSNRTHSARPRRAAEPDANQEATAISPAVWAKGSVQQAGRRGPRHAADTSMFR